MLTGPPRMLNSRALVAAGGATSAAAELVAGYLSELGARSLRSSPFSPWQRSQASLRFGAKVVDAEQIAAMGRQEPLMPPLV